MEKKICILSTDDTIDYPSKLVELVKDGIEDRGCSASS